MRETPNFQATEILHEDLLERLNIQRSKLTTNNSQLTTHNSRLISPLIRREIEQLFTTTVLRQFNQLDTQAVRGGHGDEG